MGAIILVDFGGVEVPPFAELRDELSARFGWEIRFGPAKGVPASGFDPYRNQYLAGAFLEELRQAAEPDTKYLGITEVDLYSRGMNLVFGQADVGGAASIISTARLHPENLDGGEGAPGRQRERVVKEAVHELGHTFGLRHCRDNRCVMFFSSRLPDTDIKSPDFCPRHQAELSVKS